MVIQMYLSCTAYCLTVACIFVTSWIDQLDLSSNRYFSPRTVKPRLAFRGHTQYLFRKPYSIGIQWSFDSLSSVIQHPTLKITVSQKILLLYSGNTTKTSAFKQRRFSTIFRLQRPSSGTVWEERSYCCSVHSSFER